MLGSVGGWLPYGFAGPATEAELAGTEAGSVVGVVGVPGLLGSPDWLDWLPGDCRKMGS